MAKDLKEGVLVWAKMKGFPPWPAKVAFPTDGRPPKSKKPQHFVYFFGTHDHAYIQDRFIYPHTEVMLESAKSRKKISSTMQTAIQEIEEASQEGKKKLKIKIEPVSPPPSPPVNVPEIPPRKKAVPKKKIKVETETLEDEIETPKDEPKTPDIEKKTTKQARKTRKVGIKTHKYKSKVGRKKRSATAMNNFDTDVKIEIKKEEDSDEGYSQSNVAASVDSKPNFTTVHFDSPSTSSLISKSRKKKPKKERSLKIGFLGLGAMGRELVKKLLSTGHTVTIWNRSILDIYATFVEMGAKTARHPADVIQECDITFCCVSDAEAAKCVVFGRYGVLTGFDGICGNKAYVEMTTVDPATSQEIGEAIAGKGARYLEASMLGTRQNISENSMTIVTAGERSVFSDCNSVFACWAKNAIFLGYNVGAASKMSLCLNMMAGTAYAALAESINMIQKCNINPAFFMDVIGAGPANFPLLIDKGYAMIANSPTVHTPIKHQQKNLAMALALGNTSEQPLPLASAANEAYMRALREDKESDISAVRKYS